MKLLTGTLVLPLVSLVAAQLPSSCSNSIATASPIPEFLHCGSTGSVQNPQQIGLAFSDTYGDCQDDCLGNEACISFSYDPSSDQCELYSSTIDNMTFKKSSSSTISFWNRHCFVGCPPYTCRETKCLAAVLGDGKPAEAQCSSALIHTITPAASTTTVTISLTKDVTRSTATTTSTTTTQTTTSTDFRTITVQGDVYYGKKTKPTNLPPACSRAKHYSSACSCIGVTHSTVTASTPVVTKTRTVHKKSVTTVDTSTATHTKTSTQVSSTSGTTAICAATAASTPFRVQIANVPQGASNSNPSNYDYDEGFYADLAYGTSSYESTSFVSNYFETPTTYYLDENCHLQTTDGRIAGLETAFQPDYSGANAGYNIIRFSTQDEIDASNLPQPLCQIDPHTNAFTCVGVAPSDTVFYTCFQYWRLGPAVDIGAGCEPIELVAISLD